MVVAGLGELATVGEQTGEITYKLSINSDASEQARHENSGVSIEILGGRGSTGPLSLAGKQTSKYLLEPNSTTTAEVQAADVGEITGKVPFATIMGGVTRFWCQGIIIRTSLSREWHCRDVTVDGGNAASAYTFMVKKFLHLQFQPSVHIARGVGTIAMHCFDLAVWQM